MESQTCCICNPNLQINPNVCAKHKAEGLALAKENGTRFIDAADTLYWRARDAAETVKA